MPSTDPMVNRLVVLMVVAFIEVAKTFVVVRALLMKAFP